MTRITNSGRIFRPANVQQLYINTYHSVHNITKSNIRMPIGQFPCSVSRPMPPDSKWIQIIADSVSSLIELSTNPYLTENLSAESIS